MTQAVAVIQELSLDPNIAKALGGAIALGHPVGATGAILATTLAHALQRSGEQYEYGNHVCGFGHGCRWVIRGICRQRMEQTHEPLLAIKLPQTCTANTGHRPCRHTRAFVS